MVGGPGGPPSIGLYAAGLAVALGSARVLYVDDDPDHLAVAEALGADVEEDPTRRKVGAFPITVNAGGGEAHLRCALNSTAFDGTCTNVAVLFEDPALPLFQMYSRCCTLHTGRAHARPVIPEMLDLVAAGRFDPDPGDQRGRGLGRRRRRPVRPADEAGGDPVVSAADAKPRIERAAAELLSRDGYNGMGLKALSKATDLPYGSIYHHFPGGKEEIATVAIVGTAVAIGELLTATLVDGVTDDAVRAMFGFMADRLEASDWVAGCVVGTPALDDPSPRARGPRRVRHRLRPPHRPHRRRAAAGGDAGRRRRRPGHDADRGL